MREGAQGGPGEKGTQPGNGVWFFPFRLSYRRSEKKPARPPARPREPEKQTSGGAQKLAGEVGEQLGGWERRRLRFLCCRGTGRRLPLPVPRPRQEDLQRGREASEPGAPGAPPGKKEKL